MSVTRPTTVSANSIGRPRAASSTAASSSAVRMSSSAEATTTSAPVRSACVMSDARASTVAPGGGSATASSSRVSSRSCTTQCCGPGSRGASQRPIEPLPPPRSWITSGPGGRCSASASASSADRAAASAGSRSSSQAGLTTVTPAPPRPRPWSPSSSATSPAAVSPHAAVARAGRRRRASSAAPPPAPRSRPAAPAARAACRRPPWPSASRTPPTSAAITGTPRASASVTTMPYVSAREGSTQEVRRRVRRVQLAADPRAGEAHAAVQPPGAVDHPLGVGRVADQAADAFAAPRQVLRGGERVEQDVVALVRRHRRHAEELASVRAPARELGLLHARLRHVDPVDAVQLGQPPLRPRARRDHSRRRLEHGPLLRGPERHVHEHDLPHAA